MDFGAHDPRNAAPVCHRARCQNVGQNEPRDGPSRDCLRQPLTNRDNTVTIFKSHDIPATTLEVANAICAEGGLPSLTAAEFKRFYSVPPLRHRVNTESPSRALECEHRPGWLAAMRLAILWHEGPQGLASAMAAAGDLADAKFAEWVNALPAIAAGAAMLRQLTEAAE